MLPLSNLLGGESPSRNNRGVTRPSEGGSLGRCSIRRSGSFGRGLAGILEWCSRARRWCLVRRCSSGQVGLPEVGGFSPEEVGGCIRASRRRRLVGVGVCSSFGRPCGCQRQVLRLRRLASPPRRCRRAASWSPPPGGVGRLASSDEGEGLVRVGWGFGIPIRRRAG